MRLATRIGIVLVALLAAGCFGSSRAPFAVDARAAHPASSTAGDGSFTLVVLVTDEPGGPPLAGANVAANVAGSGYYDGASVSAFTDESGRAELKLPPSRSMMLSAWHRGYTMELPRATGTGPAGSSDEMVLPLFREDVTVLIDGKLSPAGASTRAVDGNDVKWEPQRVYWAASPATNKAYNARLVLTNVTLTWTNGPTGAGDLLIAGGRTPSHADAVQDSGSQESLGPQTEKANVPFAAIDRAGWRQSDALYVGAGTGKAWAAPLGLEYKLVIQGHFDGDTRMHASPSGGLVAAILGLAAGAFILPRRRP